MCEGLAADTLAVYHEKSADFVIALYGIHYVHPLYYFEQMCLPSIIGNRDC